MATKKAQSKAPAASSGTASSSNDMSAMWKWLYVAGILVASVAGAFGFQNVILSIIFAVIGLLVGLFYFDSSDLMNFGLRLSDRQRGCRFIGRLARRRWVSDRLLYSLCRLPRPDHSWHGYHVLLEEIFRKHVIARIKK